MKKGTDRGSGPIDKVVREKIGGARRAGAPHHGPGRSPGPGSTPGRIFTQRPPRRSHNQPVKAGEEV